MASNNLTLKEAVARYQTYNRSIGKHQPTLAWHEGALTAFIGFAGSDTLLTSLTEADIDEYRAHLLTDRPNLSPNSVNTYLKSIKAFLNWALRKRYISSPIQVEYTSVDRPQPKESLTRAQVQQLVAACEQEATPLLQKRAKAIVLVLFDTGLRVSELCTAKWADISHFELDGQTAHVLQVEGAKRGGIRHVILSESTWQAITAYQAELVSRQLQPSLLFTSAKPMGKPLTKGGVLTSMLRLEQRTGIHCNPHKFRRTLADSWLNSGQGEGVQELESLLALGGWKSATMVRNHYGRVNLSTLIRSSRRVRTEHQSAS